jgi:hypothetical protein
LSEIFLGPKCDYPEKSLPAGPGEPSLHRDVSGILLDLLYILYSQRKIQLTKRNSVKNI